MNTSKEVYIGIHTMTNKFDIEIENLERTILQNINLKLLREIRFIFVVLDLKKGGIAETKELILPF